MQQQRWNILFELTLFSRIQFTSCKRHWCLENVVFSRKKKRNSSSCNFFPLIKSACVLREVCNYCYILLYICRVHVQCKSGWDDDGDDDDVDGGADFLLFCLFHVSSADEFLLQTGVVRQGVKYSCWHFYGFAQFFEIVQWLFFHVLFCEITCFCYYSLFEQLKK